MSSSRVRPLDDGGLTIETGASAGTPRAAMSTMSRHLQELPVIRPLVRMARGLLDTINCSLDAIRGRYDR